HLYRQRPQPHDLRHRDRARRQDAELLRLHGVVVRRAAAGLRAAHLRFFRAPLAFLAALPARVAPRARAGLAAFAGSTACASISKRARGRASWEMPIAVMAGRGSLKNSSRISR